MTIRKVGAFLGISPGPDGERPSNDECKAAHSLNERFVVETAPGCACVIGQVYLEDQGDEEIASLEEPMSSSPIGACEGPYIKRGVPSPFFLSAEKVLERLDVHYLLTVDSYLGLHEFRGEGESIRELANLDLTDRFPQPSASDGNLISALLGYCSALIYTSYDGCCLELVGPPAKVIPLLDRYVELVAREVPQRRWGTISLRADVLQNASAHEAREGVPKGSPEGGVEIAPKSVADLVSYLQEERLRDCKDGWWDLELTPNHPGGDAWNPSEIPALRKLLDILTRICQE